MKDQNPNKPSLQPDIANLTESELVSNQDAAAVPWFCGERLLKLNWVTPTYNVFSQDAGSGKKGGGLKAGGGNVNKLYFGSLLGILSTGPVDELAAFELDGKTIWPTDVDWNDGIIGLNPVAYSRKGGTAYLYFAVPHLMISGNEFYLNGMPDASFNEAGGAFVGVNDDYTITYANAGADVATTAILPGTATFSKVNHYVAHQSVVRYGPEVWSCISSHSAFPGTEPPNAPAKWSAISAKRTGTSNPFNFLVATSAATTAQVYGNAFMYWGTSGQNLDVALEKYLALAGHPPYRNQAGISLKDFLFGQGRDVAPNVRALVRRAPMQSIIVGGATALDADHQANVWCAFLELMTNPIYRIGLPAAAFDAASWQAMADDAAADSAHFYFSPSLDRLIKARSFIAQMLANIDGWMRFNSAGRIEVGRFTHNAAPPAFTPATTIDFDDLKDEGEYEAGGWADTTNFTVCKFQDRLRSFKEAGQPYNSGLNLRIVGEPRMATLDRQFITRQQQASDYAAEYGKIAAKPAITGSLSCRAEKVSTIKAGDLFQFNHDALSFSVVCRCTEKTLAAPPLGKATIKFASERGIAPIPYHPTPANPGGTQLPPPGAISLYQFVQPPPLLVQSQDFLLVILTGRTSQLTRGVRPWLKVDDTNGLFYDLGQQDDFAVSGALTQNYPVPANQATVQRSRAANVATIKSTAHGYATGLYVSVSGVTNAVGGDYNVDSAVITVVDADHFTYANVGTNEGVTADAGGTVTPLSDDDSETLQLDTAQFTVQADIDKISVSQTADSINDNQVLVWLFKAADPTQFEICTLKAIRLSSGTYLLKIRRARYGTIRLAFLAGDYAWIQMRSDLVTYTHEKFATFAANATAGDFRLQAFTPYAIADLTDANQCPDIAFTFHDPYAPTVAFNSLQVNGAFITNFAANYLTTDVFAFAFSMASPAGSLVSGQIIARQGNTVVTLWNQTFTPTSNKSGVAQFSLPNTGCWHIFGIATDQSGRVTTQQLILVNSDLCINTPTISYAATPVPSPAGDFKGWTAATIGLASATAGATIFYQVVAFGAPYVGGAWVNAGVTPFSGVYVYWGHAAKTVWFYASHGGLTDSIPASDDYGYESSSGGGNPP